ncbi:CheY-like chemotaxis protein [Aliiruegeria haliotis]|uniref:CheY-like chemotaxis protein n=1 Tax=Aliiruegeria haliotis TaxID=1280846 RepID=A0A2T0RPP7_9RHOB|nr:response regulator [Aliiruegeria haliotis]PRY23159.1 CheY-like chemotaxis protein [Aliiruegeria haliotis]
MNLDIGILWIEDSFSTEERIALERRIREAGFLPRIVNIENDDGIEELARQHSLYHRFDIILLDYKLKDVRGDDLAPVVRNLFPSTTILFYSGTIGESSLRSKIAANEVEGVYCSHRDRFISRTGALIEQTARSLDRLSGMRGLAIKVVAECDDIMKTSVLFITKQDRECADKVKKLDDEVFKSAEKLLEKYKTASEGSLEDRLNTRAVDSLKLFKFFRLLSRAVTARPEAFGIDAERVERLRELRNESKGYNEKILAKRNTLGHVIEIEGPEGWALQGSDDISVMDFPILRQTFAEHIDAFREMRDIIVADNGQQS